MRSGIGERGACGHGLLKSVGAENERGHGIGLAWGCLRKWQDKVARYGVQCETKGKRGGGESRVDELMDAVCE